MVFFNGRFALKCEEILIMVFFRSFLLAAANEYSYVWLYRLGMSRIGGELQKRGLNVLTS